MPSRRSPVPIASARTSKSSTTSTLMIFSRPPLCAARLSAQGAAGARGLKDTRSPGVSPVSAADTVLTPAVSYNRSDDITAKERHMSEDSTVTTRRPSRSATCTSASAQTVALDGLSFTVAPGQVTGFVGPNGAGKSTTMRVILGLDAPDAGSALVGGTALPQPAPARCATSARCSTPAPCTRAAAGATTCSGWPTRRADRRAASTR